MKKITWAVLAAFTLSLFSASAAFPPHGGEQMIAKHHRAKHHGKKSEKKSGKKGKKHKKKHHKQS